MSRILILTPSFKSLYSHAQVKEAVPHNAPLTPAVIAAPLLKENHEVKIFDFNLPENTKQKFVDVLHEMNPDIVGITFNTPMFPVVKQICETIKKVNKNIPIVAGGPHASSVPEETLKESLIDIVVLGEGDFTLSDILSKDLKEINGICYKKNKKIFLSERRNYIRDLDILPLPAWQLYDLKKYNSSDLLCKKNPLGFLETSRGCVFNCSYCNKSIFGQTFRYKSEKRVIEEIKYMLKSGFKEIYVVDDGFTTDIERAKKICRRIIKEKLNFPWQLTNGIRVDRVDRELFFLLKKAGCYRVAFGIESGNEEVLNEFGKQTNLKQVIKAVNWAAEAGVETWGYFILGLPKDTEETMMQTINFAKSLNLTLAKFSICIPYPGTRLFAEYDKKGLIKSKDWRGYNVYKPDKLYVHPNLSWNVIYKYSKRAYRDFYFRPSFILKRTASSIKKGTFFQDIIHFFNTEW